MLFYILKLQESGLIEIVALKMHLNNLWPGILFFSILNSPQGAPLGMEWQAIFFVHTSQVVEIRNQDNHKGSSSQFD